MLIGFNSTLFVCLDRLEVMSNTSLELLRKVSDSMTKQQVLHLLHGEHGKDMPKHWPGSVGEHSLVCQGNTQCGYVWGTYALMDD